MSCLECWEWFIQFVARSEHESLIMKRSEATVNEKNDEKSSPRQVETEALGSWDSEYKRQRLKQLYNKHGFNLAIFPAGHVRGVKEAFNVHAVMEIIPATGEGEVRIKGVETGLFLAMNQSGNLYAEENPNEESTLFVESNSGLYHLYLSKKFAHMGWYVGLKKNGDTKNGRKTWYPWGQNAILFIQRKPYMDYHPLKQIRNRHGYSLVIEQDGKVRGVKEESKYSVLEFIPSNPPGAFRIHGIESDLYLAMDKKGRLYGEKDRLNNNTLFTEHSMGQYYVYLSVHWSHLGWHVGIKRSGKAKKATKTVYPSQQKAIQFEHLFPYDNTLPNFQLNQGKRLAVGENFPPLAFIDEESES